MLGAIVGAVVASAVPEVIGNVALGVVGGVATVVGGKLELEENKKKMEMNQHPIRRCEYCGVQINAGQNYCIGCGAPV